MGWNETETEKQENPKDHNDRMSALALDVLTCGTMHLKCVEKFRGAISAMSEAEDDMTLKACVVAWDKAAIATLDMTRKSLEEMYSADPKFAKMIDDRWTEMAKLIESTIPMVKVMVESELAEVPPIYEFVRDMHKEDGNNE